MSPPGAPQRPKPAARAARTGGAPPLSSEETRRLLAAARAVRARAHAPYSRFRVGAAVLDEGGSIHVGCNVENASYGLTVCAERNAVAAAIAAGARRIRAVAVVTATRPPARPCGACRQVLRERGDDATIVLMAPPTGAPEERRLGDLLPESFSL